MRVQNVMLRGGDGTEGEVWKEGKETVKEMKDETKRDEIEDRTECAGGQTKSCHLSWLTNRALVQYMRPNEM
jgi:hypothetical protein